jgi:tRNA threonylcarbamoyladenosine biosynthesis protein TsaE
MDEKIDTISSGLSFFQKKEMQTIRCETPENLSVAAEKLLNAFPNARVFALHAAMGTGKTTFMQAVCRYLKSPDHASSPTFAIVNEYALDVHEKIYHMDCYRLKSIREAEEIGMEEYLYSGNYCFIEWPEIIGPMLPEETVHVRIRTENPYGGGCRIFEF